MESALAKGARLLCRLSSGIHPFRKKFSKKPPLASEEPCERQEVCRQVASVAQGRTPGLQSSLATPKSRKGARKTAPSRCEAPTQPRACAQKARKSAHQAVAER